MKKESPGQAEVRAIWKVTKIGTIAGSYVTSGVNVNQKCRLLRDGLVIYEGSISSMKHGTNDAKESQKGFECGMTLTNYNDAMQQNSYLQKKLPPLVNYITIVLNAGIKMFKCGQLRKLLPPVLVLQPEFHLLPHVQ